MANASGVALGVVIGVVCALPLVLLQRRAAHGEAHLALGLAAIAGSFLVMQVALAVVWRSGTAPVMLLGVPMVLAFLASVVAAVVIWRP